MKMASLAMLVPPCRGARRHGDRERRCRPAPAGIANPGAHGFSEILYAFSSAGNNNGSAFAGISANTPFYNVALGIAMWLVALLAHDPGARDRRQPRGEARRPPSPPARCRRTRRCSS